ncbi:MAG: molybdopterin-guanine dinucleotide biosynthesis protein B [Thermoleophilia bacterium]|nr:molybdopterin-guanine dinucleotide biosynthesis protein B [Thermoleophilia bacterium]
MALENENGARGGAAAGNVGDYPADEAGGRAAREAGGRAVRDVSLALLAGGQSTRMGFDKVLASFPGGSLIEWMYHRLAPFFENVFAVARDPVRFHDLGIPVVTDALAESGSAVGVYTAVLASPTERVLCVACDMPFVTPGLLWALALGSRGYDVFVPRHGEYLQPLCAVYGKGALDAYYRFITSGGRRIFDIYPELRTGYLDVADSRFGDPEQIFFNVNTPEELELARARAAAGEEDPGAWRLRLNAEIRAFMSRSPLPVVSFVGKKKSGKTTVVLGVLEELRRRGYRVAVIKHDTHGFDIDVPGTDSYRFREKGAEVVGISSPFQYVWVNSVSNGQEPRLEELVSQVSEPVDLVITEGFKKQNAPKIEVSRRARSTELVCRPEELIGIASDQRFPDYAVPQFSLDDFVALADLIEKLLLNKGAITPVLKDSAND